MSLIILNNTLSRLQYQNEYHSLFDALCKVYLCNGSLGFEGSFPYPDALMLLEERHSEEDTALLSPGDALEYLLDAAIDRFGYSSRDVFHAVFKYSQMTWRHKATFFFFFFSISTTQICNWAYPLSLIMQAPSTPYPIGFLPSTRSIQNLLRPFIWM